MILVLSYKLKTTVLVLSYKLKTTVLVLSYKLKTTGGKDMYYVGLFGIYIPVLSACVLW